MTFVNDKKLNHIHKILYHLYVLFNLIYIIIHECLVKLVILASVGHCLLWSFCVHGKLLIENATAGPCLWTIFCSSAA